MRRQMLYGSLIKAASVFLLIFACSGSGRADLIPMGMPPTFMPSPSPACSPVTGTFCIGFSDKDMLIRQEALNNGAEIQDFTITFLEKEMTDNIITSTDGIVTSVILKTSKDKLISFTTADEGKTKDGFMLTVLGPNKWNIKGEKVKVTPFIQMVETKGFFQVPGDKKRIKLTETLQPKGGPKITGSGEITGKISDPLVIFINESRGGDRVVSAKDVKDGLPGGSKVITIDTNGLTVDLMIEKLYGEKGSAVFEKEQKKKTGKFDATILGRDLSDRPRNLSVKAIDVKTKKIVGCFTFTVFRVDLTLLGDSMEITDKAVNENNGNLRDLAKLISGKITVGMFKNDLPRGTFFGGSELTIGKVIPTGMDPQDFFRSKKTDYKPGAGFFIKRLISSRIFLDFCQFTNKYGSGQSFNGDDQDDTSDLNLGIILTADKDLDPDPDVGKDLFIYSTDSANLIFGKSIPKESVLSQRANFSDQALYDNVACSNTLKWHLTQSIKRIKFTFGDPGSDFVRATVLDEIGDNSVGKDHVALSRNLKDKVPKVVTFRILDFESPQAKINGRIFTREDPIVQQFTFTIAGEKFPVGKAPMVMFNEISGKGPAINVTGVKVDNANSISGSAKFANRNNGGVYILAVSFSDGCSTTDQVLISVQGPLASWQFFAPRVMDDGTVQSFVRGIDDFGLVVVPKPKDAPTVIRTGGSVDFTIGKLTSIGVGWQFPLLFKENPTKTFTVKLKAEGSGVTGTGEFEVPIK